MEVLKLFGVPISFEDFKFPTTTCVITCVFIPRKKLLEQFKYLLKLNTKRS